jgi:beta-lactamase regulating signal transducer with metallopeptidase domain
MIHYVLQIVAFQLLFLIVYDFLLKKETFFSWNRTYLLLTPVLSMILPFIRLESIRESIPESYLVELPAVMVGSNANNLAPLMSDGIQFSWMYVWLAGMLFSTLLFLIKFSRLLLYVRSGQKMEHPELTVRLLPKTNAAFTFFDTIYLGDDLSEEQVQQILLHEAIHVRQKHSWDLFFFELLRIVLWFNPLVYIFQHRIGALHEYTADRQVANGAGSAYYQNLLSQVFQTNKISFINTFFNHSLIKNRIVMLQKSKSKKALKFKYLLLVPIVCAMLVYTSCAQEAEPKPVGQENDLVQSTNSEILADIAALKEAIAAKGNVSEEEARALKLLMASVQGDTKDGLHNKYFDSNTANGGMSFNAIDKVPVYPGCEGLDNTAAQKCFTEKVASFIVANFNTEKFKGSSIQGRQRIAVHFIISDDGIIKDVKAKAEFEPLMQEAVRVVNLLPKMQAGQHEGKKVNVQFSVPIIFELE